MYNNMYSDKIGILLGRGRPCVISILYLHVAEKDSSLGISLQNLPVEQEQ